MRHRETNFTTNIFERFQEYAQLLMRKRLNLNLVLPKSVLLVCLPISLWAQNGSARLAGCADPAKLGESLKALQALPWNGIPIERVTQIWPTGLAGDWCQHQSNCILLSSDDRVIENEEECGESFRFDTSQVPESDAWQDARLESIAMKYTTRTIKERDLVERILVSSVVQDRNVEESYGVRTGAGWFRTLSWTDQQPEVRSCDVGVQHERFRMNWLVMFDVECKPGKDDATRAGCPDPAKLADGLKALQNLRWARISLERVLRTWPTELKAGRCESNCMLFSRGDGRLIENELECSESLRFDTSQEPEDSLNAALESIAIKYMTQTTKERDTVEAILTNGLVRGRKVEEGRGVLTGHGWTRELRWTDQQPEVRSCHLDIAHQHLETKGQRFGMEWLVIFSLECKPGT